MLGSGHYLRSAELDRTVVIELAAAELSSAMASMRARFPAMTPGLFWGGPTAATACAVTRTRIGSHMLRKTMSWLNSCMAQQRSQVLSGANGVIVQWLF